MVFCSNVENLYYRNGSFSKVAIYYRFGLVDWGLTPQQQPGSYQDGGMMMMMVIVFITKVGSTCSWTETENNINPRSHSTYWPICQW